jgi:GT2 family glycosyltransferase
MSIAREGEDVRGNGPSAAVSVIIVNYETSKMVKRCVASLQQESSCHEIIIVDNPSEANDVAELEGLPARVIRNTENIGYGRACNVGVAESSGQLIAIMNPDTYVSKEGLDAWAEACIRASGQPGIGVLGPRLLNDNGTVQRSTYGFLTPWNYWLYHSLAAGALKTLRKRLRIEAAERSNEELRAVGWVMGAAMLIPRIAWNAVGGFSDKYFLYAEDTDLCWRMHQAGFEVMYAPGVSIYHSQGEPNAENRGLGAFRLFSSIRIFLHQHFGVVRRLSIKGCVIADMCIRTVLFSIIAIAKPHNMLNRSRLAGSLQILKLYCGMYKPGKKE